MENPTAFDLNGAIQQWRENLAEAPAFRRENLNELESNLRDSIAALHAKGLSGEEAFWVATRRVGPGSRLESEFSKVNGSALWLDRLLWMLLGYLAWTFISGIMGAISRNALFFGLYGAGYDFKAHGYVIPATLFTLVQLAGFAGSLVLSWWLFRRKGREIGRWFGRRLPYRGTMVLMFAAFFLASLSTPLINTGTMVLMAYRLEPASESIERFYRSFSFSSMITSCISTAVFVALTLVLARKRLSLSRT
jgi:hypothetical protein